MRTWARRSLWAGGIVATLLLLLILDQMWGVVGCGHRPFRIRGVVVDAETGAPLAGVDLLPLMNPAHDLKPSRDRIREIAPLSREERITLAWAGWDVGRTDATGSFEAFAGVGFSQFTDSLGIRWPETQGDPLKRVRALRVEREGYAPLVFDTKGARWIDEREGRLIGTLDVGTIRLARR